MTTQTTTSTNKPQALLGLVARRMTSYPSVGDKVQTGQRIGMIRFATTILARKIES